METLDNNSTIIFCDLMDRMKGNEYLKIEKEPFLPLVIEKLAEEVETSIGVGSIYRLCHFYKLEGNIIVEPEMEFIVIDPKSAENTHKDKFKIVPYSYIKGSIDIYQETIVVDEKEVTRFIKIIQFIHASIANEWLHKIQNQGFLGRNTKCTYI